MQEVKILKLLGHYHGPIQGWDGSNPAPDFGKKRRLRVNIGVKWEKDGTIKGNVRSLRDAAIFFLSFF